MKGLEFAILPGGQGHNDAAWNFMGYGFATEDQKTRQAAWMTFPLPCYVIHHPQAGYLMYDVGCGPGEETKRRPAEHRKINPVTIRREDYVDEALRSLGLEVGDISAIILSHCHWDHIGGLQFFKGTEALRNIYVSAADYAAALVHSHQSAKGYTDSLYYRWDIDVEGAEFHLIDAECELFPGVELLLLEGHSPAVVGLVLHLESGVYILPSDAVTAEVCYSGRYRPGTVYDSLGYDRTLRRLHELQQRYHAQLIFQHDPWSFPDYRVREWIR